MVGGEISGKVLGLVGFGGIARDVALRARACGMRVMAYDPFLPAGRTGLGKAGRGAGDAGDPACRSGCREPACTAYA